VTAAKRTAEQAAQDPWHRGRDQRPAQEGGPRRQPGRQLVERVLELEAVPVQPVRQVGEALRLLRRELRQRPGSRPCSPLGAPGRASPDDEKDGAGCHQHQGDGRKRRYASSSSVPRTPAIVATVSPSSNRMMITPWV